MATSQFANGKLEILKKQGEKLALPGGYNSAGELTQDPSEILSVTTQFGPSHCCACHAWPRF